MKIFTFNCRGKLLTISKPVVMGILNVTPDSFYDGGQYKDDRSILNQAEKMLKEGALMIDIGGQSTRPNAALVSEEEELKRVLPPLEKIHRNFPEAILSIDTFRSKVAEEAVQKGVSILNDISGGQEDEQIFKVAADNDCPLILMHRQGNFETMHQPGNYGGVVCDVFDYFTGRMKKAKEYGVKDIIIDPGFGFSKTLEQNYAVLKNLNALTLLNKAILAGLSRKSMLCKPLGIKPEDALNATTIANTIALQNGATILRVHDVKEAMECIKIYEQLKST
jgi:dihydropteroate synthase